MTAYEVLEGLQEAVANVQYHADQAAMLAEYRARYRDAAFVAELATECCCDVTQGIDESFVFYINHELARGQK